MKKLIAVVLFLLMLPLTSMADKVYLKNGTVIETEYTWEERGRINFYRYGTKVSYPKEDVEKVVSKEEKGAAISEEEIKLEKMREEIVKKQADLKSLHQSLMVEKERLEQIRETDVEQYFDGTKTLNKKIEEYNKRKKALDAQLDEYNAKVGDE